MNPSDLEGGSEKVSEVYLADLLEPNLGGYYWCHAGDYQAIVTREMLPITLWALTSIADGAELD